MQFSIEEAEEEVFEEEEVVEELEVSGLRLR